MVGPTQGPSVDDAAAGDARVSRPTPIECRPVTALAADDTGPSPVTVSAVFCPGCGHRSEPGAAFCVGCGKRLPADEAQGRPSWPRRLGARLGGVIGTGRRERIVTALILVALAIAIASFFALD